MNLSKAVQRVMSMPEPDGWPGDVQLPFSLGRSINLPKEWIQFATVETVTLADLVSTQESVDREQVVDLIKKGAPDIEPLPLVWALPDGQFLIQDGNHRLAAKAFLGDTSAKVRLVDSDVLPDEAISSAMEKGRISTKLFQQLVEQVVSQELAGLLKEHDEEQVEPLYHVTYSGRLDSISQKGLRPGSSRSIGSTSYDTHAAKGIFLTEEDGISFWMSRAEDFANSNSDNPHEDGLVPVVLKVSPSGFNDDELVEDDLGTSDSRSEAYIWPGQIGAAYLQVWDGSSWVPVSEWDSIDFLQAFDKEELEGEDGEEERYYLFKYTSENPLVP